MPFITVQAYTTVTNFLSSTLLISDGSDEGGSTKRESSVKKALFQNKNPAAINLN